MKDRLGRRPGVDAEEKRDDKSLRERLFVPTLVLTASFMAVVSSLGAPLLPTIARADKVSLSTAEWILTITLMTGALATPVMGRLADGPRQREVTLFALAAVAVGCVLAAVSDGFVELIAGRALQGVGLGVVPVAMATAQRNLPPERARRTIATLSITVALGVGVGYPVTGLLAQAFDYRASYWFGGVLVGSGLVLAAAILPAGPPVASRPFDVTGAITLSLVVVGITVFLSEGGDWGWSSGQTLATLIASVVLGMVWVAYELRRADPLVDLRQVRNRSVMTADVSGLFIAMAMYLLIPVVVEFVQVPSSDGYGFGASTVVSGLVLVPLSIGTFSASRFLAMFEKRFGTKVMVPLGSILTGVSGGFFALDHSALWEAFLAMGLAGLGMGFSFGAMPGFIVRAVPRGETGSATGFYQVLRSIGLTVGSAVTAAVLAAHTGRGQSLPAVQGFRDTLLIAFGLCLVTMILSYLLPGNVGVTLPPLTATGHAELDEMLEEEAELAGSGMLLGEEPSPFHLEDGPA